MKTLHFSYEMQIKYSVPVDRCFFTIKCIPVSNLRQTVDDTLIELYPETTYSMGKDGLRNTQIYGIEPMPHDEFRFKITGNAVAGLSEYDEEVDEDIAMIFRHPYGFNVPGNEIKEYFKGFTFDSDDDYEKAVQIMHRLNTDFKYEPCSTDIKTSAEEAFCQRKGVCQDYAHIFISLLHLAGISARYVTGLIVGEGASHAWVEILYDNKWYGLDPTNDVIVTDEHIKIGVGRDASDCMINRGIMHGGGLHTQIIKVSVTDKNCN